MEPREFGAVFAPAKLVIGALEVIPRGGISFPKLMLPIALVML